jgi:hypothetical protein
MSLAVNIELVLRCTAGPSGLQYGTAAGFFEHCNEHSCPTEVGNFVGLLSDHQFEDDCFWDVASCSAVNSE